MYGKRGGVGGYLGADVDHWWKHFNLNEYSLFSGNNFPKGFCRKHFSDLVQNIQLCYYSNVCIFTVILVYIRVLNKCDIILHQSFLILNHNDSFFSCRECNWIVDCEM